MKISCKNCEHWKNHQRLLNYKDSIGVCLNPKFDFSVSDGRPIGVIDTMNIKDQSKVSGNPSHDVEVLSENLFDVKFSRYLLSTDEEFGCKFFEQRK